MPLKPPLSLDELRAIGERNPDNADVKALLWEIKRYHVLMSRFHQLANSVPDGGAAGLIAQAARNEMSDDPAVQELIKYKQELFKPESHPSDDDD